MGFRHSPTFPLSDAQHSAVRRSMSQVQMMHFLSFCHFLRILHLLDVLSKLFETLIVNCLHKARRFTQCIAFISLIYDVSPVPLPGVSKPVPLSCWPALDPTPYPECRWSRLWWVSTDPRACCTLARAPRTKKLSYWKGPLNKIKEVWIIENLLSIWHLLSYNNHAFNAKMTVRAIKLLNSK